MQHATLHMFAHGPSAGRRVGRAQLAAALCTAMLVACSTPAPTPAHPQVDSGTSSSDDPSTPSDGSAPAADEGGDSEAPGEPPPVRTPVPSAGAVFVHLFEWRWADIAEECERYLGPAGFEAVQISPPTEHVLLPNSGYPWWQRYQTVSYSLEQSRSGTRAEFVDMVERCARVGVGIYVDAVINHMTARGSGTGSAGSTFTKYEYPPLYGPGDFHEPRCAIADEDYVNDGERVQRCELLRLSDLATESAPVQDKIASYLSELVRIGVRGFRIDAAKHMAATDLDAITRKVRASVGDDASPYYYFEIFGFGGEAVAPEHYLPIADAVGEARASVLEFRYSLLGNYFRAGGGGKLSSLVDFAGSGAKFVPSARAVVFINNHDTQRNDGLFYQDGARFDLATIYMLAHPYGYPSLMSSYVFARPAERDRGPPSDKTGKTLPVYASEGGEPDCEADPQSSTGGWVCEHRRSYVPGMLSFRRATAGAALEHWWDNGENQIAFARQSKGFVVINAESSALTRTFDTGLPAGDYCDAVNGKVEGGTCTGSLISVDSDGRASITTGPRSATTIHVGASL